MNVLVITYAINGMVMVAAPICLTIYLTRKLKQGWQLFWIGGATFIFSQVLHIPFNALVTPVFNRFEFISTPVIIQNILVSLFLGASAGLFEELSRYGMYRWWTKDSRSWGKGLILGAGHGGVEAIILGLLVLYQYIQMLIVRGMDISTVVTADKIELAITQIQAYWSVPWYLTLLGAVERLSTIPLHLACSVLVLQAFTRKQIWGLVIAIVYHALVDSVAVYVARLGFSALFIEGIIVAFGILSIGIIYFLYRPEPLQAITATLVPFPLFVPKPIEENRNNLEETRFQ